MSYETSYIELRQCSENYFAIDCRLCEDYSYKREGLYGKCTLGYSRKKLNDDELRNHKKVKRHLTVSAWHLQDCEEHRIILSQQLQDINKKLDPSNLDDNQSVINRINAGIEYLDNYIKSFENYIYKKRFRNTLQKETRV